MTIFTREPSKQKKPLKVIIQSISDQHYRAEWEVSEFKGTPKGCD